MNRRWIPTLILIALAVAVPIAVGGGVAMTAPPAQVSDTIGDATITFTGDRNVLFWRTGCLGITWKTANIAAISFNGEPTVGVGEREVCVSPNKLPRLKITLPNDTRHIYDLPVTIVTATTAFGVAMAASLGLLIVAGLASPPMVKRLRAKDTHTRTHLVALALVLIVGIGLRAIHLDRPLFGDESFTVTRFASQSLDEIRADYSDVNNHILHTMLVHLSIESLGLAPWTIRLPAFIAGLMILPLTYLTGRAWLGREAALLATALVAVHPMLIAYSVNGRGYTMVTACFLALLWLAVYGRGRVRWWVWPALATVSAAGFATVTVFLYPMVLAGVWWTVVLLAQRRQRIVKLGLFTASLAAGALLTLWFYAPIMSGTGLAAFTRSGYVVRTPVKGAFGFASDGVQQLIGITTMWLPFGLWLAVALFIGLVAARLRRDLRYWIVDVCLVTLAIVLGILRYPLHPRAWLFGIPLILLGSGAGIAWLLWRWRRGGLTVHLATVGLLVGYGGWVLMSDVMLRLDETGAAYGAEETAILLGKVAAADPDLSITLVPFFTADLPLKLYYEILRLDPRPANLDIQYGTQLTELANRIQAGEPVALYYLDGPSGAEANIIDYYLWDSPPALQAQFEIETIATYPQGWALRRLALKD